jgi:hypothetical protein
VGEGVDWWMGVWIVFCKFLEIIKMTSKKINSTVFWNVKPCSLLGLYGRFRGMYCPYLQDLIFKGASSVTFVKNFSVWKSDGKFFVTNCL